MKTLLIAIALVVLSFGSAVAQTVPPNTTLSAAVTATATRFAVASATGITVNQTVLAVESEAMLVTGLSGTTVTVVRGHLGTNPISHASGKSVLKMIPGETISYAPNGSCTNGTDPAGIIPRVFPAPAGMGLFYFRCSASVWTGSAPLVLTFSSLTLSP